MIRTLRLSILALSVGLFFSCDSMKDMGGSSNLLSMLTQNTWVLNSLGGKVLSSATSDLPFLNFGENGVLSGFSGCNNFNGSFDLEGTKVSLDPGAMTRKACEGSMEDQFLNVLKSADNLSFEGSKLNLLNGASVLASFLPKN